MVCISAVYLAVSAVLSFTDTSFRTWANVLGQMVVGILTPIMILVLALAFLYRSGRVHQAVKTVCIVSAVIVCGIYVCVAMLFISLGSQEERLLTRHLLVTNEGFLSKTQPVYYRPTAFFFKSKTEITIEDQTEYLEETYQRSFGVDEPSGTIYDWSFPEAEVSVWPAGMSLADNYVDELTLACLKEAYYALEIERDYHIIQDGADGIAYMCLEASGYDDIPALSKDITRLYEYVLSGRTHGNVTEIYRKHMGGIYYSFGETDRNYTGVITFGNTDKEQTLQVESLVRYAYLRYGTGQDGSEQNPFGNTWEGEAVVDEMPSELEQPEPEPEPDYREVAAKAVYDAALAEEGFSYEVYYNAKGNLYIDLGCKTSEEDGKVYSYRLVYDRTSKNGACELLVLYRSLEGSDNEAIVDIYAVENATGKVVASGRKAWSDVGTKEYREMTGE